MWFLSVLLSLVSSCFYITCVMVTVALSPNSLLSSSVTERLDASSVSQAHVEQNTEPLRWQDLDVQTYDFDMFQMLSQGTKRKYCVLGRTLHLE